MNRKRILAWLLTLAMIVGMFPAAAFAEEEQPYAGEDFEVSSDFEEQDMIDTALNGEGQGEEALADGEYTANITSSLSMVTPDTPVSLTINGENAVLHIVLSNDTAVSRYQQIYIGKYENINEENIDTIGIDADARDGKLYFDAPVKTANLTEPIYFVIRYKAGYSADHDGDWYKSKKTDNYYFTLTNIEKVQDQEEDADYSAVDAAIDAAAALNLSLYTDETAAAVTAALNAVVRGKKASEQAEVDAMAQAINDAVAALVLKEEEPQVTDLTVVNNVYMFGVASAQVDNQGIITVTMKKDSFPKAYVGDGALVTDGTETIELTADKKFVLGVLESGVPTTVAFYSAKSGWYNRSLIYDAANKTLTFNDIFADYSGVEAAIASIPQNMETLYTEESVQAVNTAVDAAAYAEENQKKNILKQAEVDAMAQAICDAVAGLEIKTVGVTFAAKDNKTEGAVDGAQFTVTDGEDKAIESENGVFTLRVGNTYKISVEAEGYRTTTVNYVATDTETSFTVGVWPLNHHIWLQVSRAESQYAESTPAGTGRGEFVLIKKEGGEWQIAQPDGAHYVFNYLEAGATYTVKVVWEGHDVITDQEWDVEKHGYFFFTEETSEWTTTFTVTPKEGEEEYFTNLIARFIRHEEEPELDYTAVEEAVATVPENLLLFTADSADAVRQALDAVDYEAETQDAIDEMAAAVTTAVQGLIPEDGIYVVDIQKFNGTPYYLFEGLGDSDKNNGRAMLFVKDGVMQAQLVLKNQSYGHVFVGTKEEAVAAAEAAEAIPASAIEIVFDEEQTAVNGKTYKSSRVTVPVAALQTKIAYAYHSSNTTRYTYNTGWYDHGVTYLANSLVRVALRLHITNTTSMFKGETAYLVEEEGQKYVMLALSGAGYHELYKGTYEEAVANGDGSKDKGNDTWIHGYENADGKWEFWIPISEGESYVPLVAVSNSYYGKYLDGQNDLARAFYPRQFTLDLEEKTLVTGDYEYSQDLAVTNNVKMLKVDKASLDTVGGPNSNGYTKTLVLTMGSTAYDQLFIGTAAEAAAADAAVALAEDQTFSAKVLWMGTAGSPETTVSYVGQEIYVSLHSVKNDLWYERKFEIDEENAALTIDPSEADYTAVNAAVAEAEAINRSLYSDESLAVLDAAVAAVVTGKFESEQAAVDAMAAAILDAIGSLEYAELTITNNTGMFKAVTAHTEEEEGQTILVMALSGTGYHELYKGTYEAAVANGDGTKENGNDTWIHGYTNADGKWEFRIPISEGESYVPIVAVSASYYTKYLNGQNTLARAFYPRQFTLDLEEKTLVTDDYKETTEFTVTSNIADFKIAATATTSVVGGPNSNGYSVSPTLVMNDTTYDKVTYPTVVGSKVGTASADLTDGAFAISMTNAPNQEAFQDKTPIEMTFHVAEYAPYEEAGTDVVRTVTIDKSAKTIVIDGTPLTDKTFVTSITLNQTKASLAVGKSITLKATVKPDNATDKSVTWTTSNKNVATVTQTGVVKAVKAGTATITCTAKDGSGKKATCTVTVTQPVTSIKLNKTKASIFIKKSLQLKATIGPSDASNKGVTWKSSNTKVAKVSSTGKVTAKNFGKATITCTAKDGSGKKATCVITVTRPVTKITLNKTKATLKVKKTLQLKATVIPNNATNKRVTWKSSNTKIATVSSSGKVTAKKAGKVTITCTAKDGSGKKATCAITVKK